MKKILLILIITVLITLAACTVPINKTQKTINDTKEQDNLVGNDRDEHGCIGSAGYVWCEEKEQCIRPWEENCTINTENTNSSLQIKCAENNGKWIEEAKECEGLTKETCEKLNGSFDDCASACRNNPSTRICTMQCVIVCRFN